jgi:hypothetical protein
MRTGWGKRGVGRVAEEGCADAGREKRAAGRDWFFSISPSKLFQCAAVDY